MNRRRTFTSLLVAAAVAFGLMIPVPSLADTYEFTSASDPTKKFRANLTNYDAKKGRVTVRRKNGRVMTFPEARITSEDLDWVKRQHEIIKIGRHVKIDAKAQHGDRKVKKGDGKKSIATSKYFDIEISNTNKEDVKGLTVRYEIHVTQGGKRGVIKGEEESISSLFSGVPHRFKSSVVDLSQTIPLATASGGAGCST